MTISRGRDGGTRRSLHTHHTPPSIWLHRNKREKGGYAGLADLEAPGSHVYDAARHDLALEPHAQIGPQAASKCQLSAEDINQS